ncbi:MAG: hypothetical protein GY893_00545, partial [bacterium]|nr:hypothetical protein [bacterium]
TLKLSSENNLEICVEDSGIGISSEAIPKLFKAFSQASSSTNRQYGGTGLGLTISKQLAQLMDGDLTATSQTNIGSAFTLTLPLIAGELNISPQPLTQKMDHLQGLLVEDNSIYAEIALSGLRQRGISMLHTKQTTKALEIINSTANLDFILFDLASIHGDVNRLLAQLEAMKDLPACIFIHSATFLTLNHEHWHPNFTFIAEKPLLSSDFPRLINNVLSQDDDQTDPKDMHHGINIKGMRILLAEDNSINQLVVKKLLETQGCVLDIAEDGA